MKKVSSQKGFHLSMHRRRPFSSRVTLLANVISQSGAAMSKQSFNPTPSIRPALFTRRRTAKKS